MTRSGIGMLAAVAALAACAPPPEPAAPPAPLSQAPADPFAPVVLPTAVPAVLWRQQSAPGEPVTSIVRDAAGWEALWARAGAVPPRPLRAGEVGVGIFLGTRPTGGYGIDVVAAAPAADGTVRVEWAETRPPPGAAAAQVVTHPAALVAVDAGGAIVSVAERR
jgi:hypothetical protein